MLREASKQTVAELAWKEVYEVELSPEDKKRIEGKIQVPFTQGSWFFVALDAEHTLAEYHSWVDPGGNIPAGPASQFAMGGIEETFMEMEKYARGQTYSMCQGLW